MEFSSSLDVTQDWADFFLDELDDFSQRSEAELSQKVDRMVYHPGLMAFLEKAGMDGMSDSFEELSLGEVQNKRGLARDKKVKFRKFKKSIRELICEAIDRTGGDDDEIDWVKVAKYVVDALVKILRIPIPDVVLELIARLIAYFLKVGYEKICDLPN